MFKNRPTAVIAIVGIIAFITMVVAMIIAPQGVADQPTAADSDADAGAAFLAANAQEPDVQVTASGLQYTVITEGDGAMPTADSTVTIDYEGRLIDGTVFDSGESLTYPLRGFIAGWVEGLQLMNVGSTYRFYIPSELAYGANPPQGSGIPVNAPLVFDVTLLSVQ